MFCTARCGRSIDGAATGLFVRWNGAAHPAHPRATTANVNVSRVVMIN
jgi:hypothetical protein